MEQQTGSKLGKAYVKAIYCHPAYLTYMQCTSLETLDWKKHKLESRLLGEQCQTLFWGAPKSLQMIIAAMKLKDAYSLERSEEHTSELQSPKDLVCRLLLEKKKVKENGRGEGVGGAVITNEQWIRDRG